jgi:hypothetical protein
MTVLSQATQPFAPPARVGGAALVLPGGNATLAVPRGADKM